MIYLLWFAVNSILLFASGYMHKIAISFLNMKWEKFLEIDSAFYIIDSANIEVYDVSDFLVYLLAPYFVYSIISKMFFRKYRIAK